MYTFKNIVYYHIFYHTPSLDCERKLIFRYHLVNFILNIYKLTSQNISFKLFLIFNIFHNKYIIIYS
jgi:hypothetical protein